MSFFKSCYFKGNGASQNLSEDYNVYNIWR